MARINDVRQRLGGDPTVGQFLEDLADDLESLRDAIVATQAKLDDDASVADENYEATLAPAALLTKRGITVP